VNCERAPQVVTEAKLVDEGADEQKITVRQKVPTKVCSNRVCALQKLKKSEFSPK
jgi:hypothetical protein